MLCILAGEYKDYARFNEKKRLIHSSLNLRFNIIK
jgi:hypothetical protein